MQILVLGATGYVGFPVTEALARNGHIVYGQTRSDTKAKQLGTAEIKPIVTGENVVSDAWLSLIPTLDVVVNCVRDFGVAGSIFQTISQKASSSRPEGAAKLLYVLSTGTSTHRESRELVQNDMTPVTTTSEYASTNKLAEIETLKGSESVDGIVVQPSLVYGRGEFLFAWWFSEAVKASEIGGKLIVPGSKGGRTPTIHTDDLARLYVSVIEKNAICRGKVFLGCNDFMESFDDICNRIVEVVGGDIKGWEYRETTNPFEKAVFNYNTLLKPEMGKLLVGWQPRKMGFADGIRNYYDAWVAAGSKPLEL